MEKPPLNLIIGNPTNIKKYNLLKTFFKIFFSLVLILIILNEIERINNGIIIISILISGVIAILKNTMKFNDIGNIIIDDNGIKIYKDDKMIEYKSEDISKIIFTYNFPEDIRYQKFPVTYSGFQNKIKIVTDITIEHYIFCKYSTYRRIRTFRKGQKLKIKIRYSPFI